MQHTTVLKHITTVLPAALIHDLARDLGALTRQRKVWLAPLVWCLVLGSLCPPHGSLADFHRLYCVHMGARLARSSFYERLTPALTALMSALLKRALRANRRSLAHWMCEPTEFDDVLATDASVITLRDGLRHAYEACTRAGAALKVDGILSVLDVQAHRLRLSSQADHDLLGLRTIRRWCRGKLLLMDLGYYSFAVFDDICAHGGFFVSRAKSGCAARIVKDYA